MELLLVLLIIGIISLIPIINSSFLSSYQEGGVTQINQLLNSLKKESQLIRKPIAIEKNNENYYLVSYEDNSWKNYDILDFDLNLILKNYIFNDLNNDFLENRDRSFLIIFYPNGRNSGSLLEVGVSILILSIALLTIFQSISFNNSNLDSIKKKAFARQIIINRISSYEFIDPIRINSSRSFDYVFGPYNFLVFEEMSVTGINKKQFSIRVSLDDEVISEYITLAGNE